MEIICGVVFSLGSSISLMIEEHKMYILDIKREEIC